MKKYRAWFQANADMYVTFEADVEGLDEDEAREVLEEKAYGEAYVSLCHQCGRKVDLGDFELGDAPDAIEEVG